MATITLRVEDGTRADLERLAQARETSVSELLRDAIADLLGTRRDLAGEETPRSMTMVDRRVLALLHEVLDRVDPAGDHRRQVEALESGFTSEYSYAFGGLRPELPMTESTLVHDILEMFSVLERNTQRLGDRVELGDRARGTLEFAGFDFNHARESRLAEYAEHLIDTGRWTEMAHHFDDQHERGNSHWQMLDRYQRMLTAYRAVVTRKKATAGVLSADIYNFDIADLREILTAADA